MATPITMETPMAIFSGRVKPSDSSVGDGSDVGAGVDVGVGS